VRANGHQVTRSGPGYLVSPTSEPSNDHSSHGITAVPDPRDCLSTDIQIKSGQSNAIEPVTEHVLELAFTKATIIAAATGFLHATHGAAGINLTKYALYPGPIDPTFFTSTLLMQLNNPPTLPGDTVPLTQPGRRLMWVLGSTRFEDHFVVAESALNGVKMRVSITAFDALWIIYIH
jgi:hypothetical protein